MPGIEPCVELVRLMGGVRIRRPNLSNLAGEPAREIIDEAEPIRCWCRGSGRTGTSSVLEEEGSEVGAGMSVGLSDLLAFTRLTAAWDSCFGELSVAKRRKTRERYPQPRLDRSSRPASGLVGWTPYLL